MEMSHKTQAAVQFLLPASLVYTIFGAYLLNQDLPTLFSIQANSMGFAAMGIAAMLVQDIVPKQVKEVIVFWRFKYRLPGHRAFTSKFLENRSIDVAKIQNIDAICESSSDVQQREFYKLYKTVSELKSVSHYSQRYIAWRDLSSLLLILGLVSFPVLCTLEYRRAMEAGVVLSCAAFIALLFTSLAARNCANELVVLVLSLVGHGGIKNV
jgi:hypothetical protein